MKKIEVIIRIEEVKSLLREIGIEFLSFPALSGGNGQMPGCQNFYCMRQNVQIEYSDISESIKMSNTSWIN